MKPGKEMDIAIATEVLGYSVHRQKNIFYEGAPKGTRPLRAYSKDIQDAWEVAEKMGITLIPIEGGSWFAYVGPKNGWKDPAEFMRCLQSADFVRSGAAISESGALSICLAALNAIAQRKTWEKLDETQSSPIPN